MVYFRYSDLVVGSPYYSSREKDKIRVGGAVYVYIGNGSVVGDSFICQVVVVDR